MVGNRFSCLTPLTALVNKGSQKVTKGSQWEYKLSANDSNVFGPFDSATMKAWQSQVCYSFYSIEYHTYILIGRATSQTMFLFGKSASQSFFLPRRLTLLIDLSNIYIIIHPKLTKSCSNSTHSPKNTRNKRKYLWTCFTMNQKVVDKT